MERAVVDPAFVVILAGVSAAPVGWLAVAVNMEGHVGSVFRIGYMSHRKPLVEEDTRRWLERAVIGLNLCPFAKAVHVKGQVHYAVSDAVDAAGLRRDLVAELAALAAANPQLRDTTLVIAPNAFPDFLDFNDFLAEADRALAELGLEGTIQIASFHPRFQFGGTAPDDITNYTNRAPYPTLHLIREASIDRAVQAFPEAEAIYEVNMATLEKLGPSGWAALDVGATPSEPSPAPGRVKGHP